MITMPQFSASCLCKQYLTEISFKLDVFIAMEKCINELSYSESYINFFFITTQITLTQTFIQ